MHFGFLDIILVLPLIWAVYKGVTKGFVGQLASLGALILGIFGSIKLSGLVGNWIHVKFDMAEKLAHFSSFVILFVVILILVFFISRLIQSSIKSAGFGVLDKILGVLFALIKWIVILSVILTFFDVINQKMDFVERKETEKSCLYKPLVQLTPKIFPSLRYELK